MYSPLNDATFWTVQVSRVSFYITGRYTALLLKGVLVTWHGYIRLGRLGIVLTKFVNFSRHQIDTVTQDIHK